MITQEERIIRKSQGYDIGFEKDGKKYWINSSTWNKEKEERLFKKTGLKTFREETGKKNLVFYDPHYFEMVIIGYLRYIGSKEKDIPQPINMSSAYCMFEDCSKIRSLDLSNWNAGNIKNMVLMFLYCTSLQLLNLSNWDISNVKHSANMFYGCSSLHSKYGTKIDKDLLEKIIEDSNKQQQANKIDLF